MVKPPKYPKAAEENKISGTVTVEWEVSEEGYWSNPVVIKSLGYGCDEEALKIVRSLIEFNNRCRQQCKIRKGTKTKIKQSFNFQYTDE